jgi:hypothetical protein
MHITSGSTRTGCARLLTCALAIKKETIMTWQKINFTAHKVNLGALDKIVKEFIDTALKAGSPMNKVGVFAGKDQDEKMPIYFTPNAIKILFPVVERYAPSPCNKLRENEIESFIFGDETCWDLLS